MRKLLIILNLIGLCFVSTSEAAIRSDTNWEVRTTGNDNSGGGFSDYWGGTDYSQQDTAQLSLTDLAMTAGTTTLTSATGGFTSDMVGNIIHITAGTNFVAGFYQITGYTDTNTVTIDRDATNGTDASAGTGYVGGALATIQKATDGKVGYNKIYIKAGTYAESVTISGGGGGSGAKTEYIGYNTTRGDNPIGANRPVIDATGYTNVMNINGNYDQFAFYNLIFENATGDGFTGNSLSTGNGFKNCRFTNNGGMGLSGIGVLGIIFCEFDTNTSYGTNRATIVWFSYIHDNGNTGYYGYSHQGVYFTISDTNSGDGFSSHDDNRYVGDIAYNNTGNGFYIIAGSNNGGYNYYFNNIALSNTSYGFNIGHTVHFFDYNCYYGNTSGGLNGVSAGAHDITSDPLFTDPANGDFTLQSGSPALNAGLDIGTYTSVTGSYKWNIGVDQDDNTSGGGSSEHSYGFVQ